MDSVLVGNRTVTLEDFYKVSCLQFNVQLEAAVVTGMKKSAGLAKLQEAPDPHGIIDGDDESKGEGRFTIDSTKEQTRATLFFHLVWFMAGRSDVRPQVVQLLSQLLNEDIIPMLPRSHTYVFTLMQFLSNGDEGTDSVKVFGNKTFASLHLKPLGELTGFETAAFTRDHVMETSIIFLHHAARMGQFPSVRLLLADCTNSHIPLTKRGWNNMHVCAYHGFVDTIEAILSINSQLVHSKTVQWETPLHLAARSGHVRACELLLNGGALINAQIRGLAHQPLHEAAMRGYYEVCALLVRHGADPYAKEHGTTNRTALKLARDFCHNNCVTVMLNGGRIEGLKSDGKSGTELDMLNNDSPERNREHNRKYRTM